MTEDVIDEAQKIITAVKNHINDIECPHCCIKKMLADIFEK
jgi:hypothetical protein